MEDEFGQSGYDEAGTLMETDVSEAVEEGLEDEGGQESGEFVDPSRLAGVALEASVELGRLRLPASQVLGLTVGSVLELDRPIDETAHLRVGGKLVARGRLVEVEGKLGLQVTELFQ